ncbi:2-(1,2-epoxy-1,2-dihydrophenyl)acetyl-CoA isomerase [Dyadobacter beijingensis]|uniref:2-(1,2-epoxy-1,2-dihydrophenyl)acetyl-CoA isomerase n=1 Tax=Dyadobacter beijingensis TaxID=365489 RepID=A0ABQ2HDV6_9BACT|nr:enoyl-CoA hydratase-related protein [Dyadobacter beijingensis]GGM74570.1 2-(1,2-epoxy-1,2-dihydrophenyl)acetyl-CoA isomerase [Dyadobacter beijingensis]
MYQNLIFDNTDGIVRITLNRPDVFHALSPALIAEITRAVQTAADDDSVRVVLLTATGEKAFCSGADLKEASASGKSAGEILRDYYEPMINAIRDIPKPVICRMNGLAVGAGCSLALACDMVIAAEDTYLSLAFIQIGLMPDAGATFFLPRLIGLARSFDLATNAQRIYASHAHDIGLITRVVEREGLDALVEKQLAHYRHAPTQAIGAMKHAFNQSMHSNLPQMLETERESQGMLFGTQDVREGIAAFLEKRKPDFQGN